MEIEQLADSFNVNYLMGMLTVHIANGAAFCRAIRRLKVSKLNVS